MERFMEEENRFEELREYERRLVDYLVVLHSTGLTAGDFEDIKAIISYLYYLLNSTYQRFTQKYGCRSERRIIEKQPLYDSRFAPLVDTAVKMPDWSSATMESYRRERHEMKRYTKCLNDILYGYKRLENFLLERLIGETPSEFIKRQVSLTHLVYTNNTYPKIRPHSKNSFMFLCWFHYEKKPSFSVDNLNRSGHCYACGKNADPISYIMLREELGEEEAIGLIANVYNIDMPPYTLKRNGRLIDKYQTALVNPEFRELLDKGYRRTQHYRLTSQVRLALDAYERDFQTIERVKAGQSISYVSPKDLPKRLILEHPFAPHE